MPSKKPTEYPTPESRQQAEQTRAALVPPRVDAEEAAREETTPVPAPPSPPLSCRCGSDLFTVLQYVAFVRHGETVEVQPADPPPSAEYTCANCGDSGAFGPLTGRLHG